jgi:hypothetical protein
MDMYPTEENAMITEFGYGPQTFAATSTEQLQALVTAGATNAADLAEHALIKAAREEIQRRATRPAPSWLAAHIRTR